ncbi:MAG: division/cell wall cluster transcriptional repressor MraZ [Syntrophomonadaceae bacterium]|jgi:MraZ protein|nr:division/cell wall cluster transcriptional repressor MraZ [Syntrophomonadaceae bacterium]
MFMGEFHHSIDEKGRLTLPARFRDGLGERFVITKGLDNCLFVYPMDEWANLEQKLRVLPFTNGDARAFVRFFLSGAAECELDRQGRILLPANLREYGQLEKDAVVIGVSSRVEIWAKEAWEVYSQKAQINYEGLAEKIVDLGI